jgi:hypothetical protein
VPYPRARETYVIPRIEMVMEAITQNRTISVASARNGEDRNVSEDPADSVMGYEGFVLMGT